MYITYISVYVYMHMCKYICIYVCLWIRVVAIRWLILSWKDFLNNQFSKLHLIWYNDSSYCTCYCHNNKCVQTSKQCINIWNLICMYVCVNTHMQICLRTLIVWWSKWNSSETLQFIRGSNLHNRLQKWKYLQNAEY